MKLSIIIVSWNVREDVLKCLRSIEENRPLVEFEIIVVDNASSDGTVEAIKKSFPEVRIIANKENRGFAAANNQGIEASSSEYVIFLNPDTIVHPNSLDNLIRFLDQNQDVGACGPKILNDDGTTQQSVRRFPTFRGALYRHTFFRFLRLFREQYKKWLMKDFDYDRQMDVDQVMGAAMIVGRSVLEEVGRMDEKFFMYYEEVDLCYRIKQTGRRVVFLPKAMITHRGERSSEQIPVERRIMMLTSMIAFFRKHRGKFATGLFNILFKTAVILRNICHLVIGIVTYVIATVRLDSRRKKNAIEKINRCALLLSKYLWRLLFKM